MNLIQALCFGNEFNCFFFLKKNVIHRNLFIKKKYNLKVFVLKHVYELYTQSVVIGILDNRIREAILTIQNYK